MASHIFHITSVAPHNGKSLNSTWLPSDETAVGTYHFMYVYVYIYIIWSPRNLRKMGRKGKYEINIIL